VAGIAGQGILGEGGVFIMATAEELLSSISGEVRSLSDDARRKFDELSSRTLLLEQKGDAYKFRGASDGDDNDIGLKVIQSDSFKALQSGATKSTGRISVGNIKTALVNATGASQPLVAADRVGIVPPITRRLSIRDVLPTTRTNSSLIEFPKGHRSPITRLLSTLPGHMKM
jgi:hypothetical protein